MKLEILNFRVVVLGAAPIGIGGMDPTFHDHTKEASSEIYLRKG